jgi:plastocyanin
MNYQSQARLAAVTLAAGMAIAACGQDGAPAPTTTNTVGQPTGAQQPSTGTSVPVRLTEMRIELPQQSFAPGTYTFVASNEGRLPHALEIEGGGLEQATDTLSAGQSADLTVTLQPGTYKVYCPVGNHDEQGMNTTITVSG